MADTATAPAADSNAGRPQKPDEASFKATQADLEKAHKAAQADFNTARSNLDAAKSGKGSPQQDRWSELIKEQNEIRAKQSTFKSSRQVQQTRYDANDREIKALINQQKEAKSRLGFKSAGEIESKITAMMKQVDSGTMKLVDEKKTLTEVSNLRRQIKSFGQFDEMEAKIEAKKKENAELKKTFDNAETKALSDKYEANSKELDAIKASKDDSNKNWSKLKAERDDKYAKQEATWKAIQEHKDVYYKQRKEHKEYEDKLYQARRDKQRQERESYEKEKRKKVAEAHLEEASTPAFAEEIITAEGLIRHFDPSYSTPTTDAGPGKFAASAERKVDEAGFKGMSVMKKEEEDFFVGAGGKKKGKGAKKTTADTNKFNLSIDIIQGLSKLGVDAPGSQAEVPATVEKLKEKVSVWKKDQKSQTEKNIEKAKKEIERLEAEAAQAPAEPSAPRARGGGRQDRSKKAVQKDAGINDAAQENNVDAEAVRDQEKNGVADATKDLQAASLEDKEDVATSA